MQIDKERLSKIIPDRDRLIFDKDIEEKYLCDSLMKRKGYADVLVFVTSTDEVRELLKYANESLIPVTPRGAGTGLIGAAVPDRGGMVLDFSKMNRILEFDPDTYTVTVEPGILLKDLQEFVEKHGLFYPPDPGEKEASIGGNISTNAGGMRAVKYGVTRDYVRGLELVTAGGEVIFAGSKNVKDSSGLSLKNLLIGSEGTLAVITKCVLKLIPKPEKSVSVVAAFNSLEDGIDSVIKFLRSDIVPTAIEFLERRVVKLGEDYLKVRFPGKDAASYILMVFDGNPKLIEEGIKLNREIAFENKAVDYVVLADERLSADVWELRGAIAKAVDALSPEWEPVDIVVPIDKTAQFVKYVSEVEQKSGMKMYSCGHAGDGNVHLWVLREGRSDADWNRELDANMDLIYSKAYELGGLTSGEHGIGSAKRRHFIEHTDKANIELMNRIKDSFDPKHIFNEGKSYINELVS